MSEPAPSKEDLIARAWQSWREADYSWAGLANKEWRDGKTLQNYWLSDPETGHPRTEDDLRAKGELIEVEGQPTYHICHLPLTYADGTPTPKTTDPETVQSQMDVIIHARLRAAIPTSEDDEEIKAAKARLDGIVCLDLDLSKKNFNGALNLRCNQIFVSGNADFQSATFLRHANFFSATFLRHADFQSATFSGNADFTTATFSGYAHFQSATVSGYAHFRSATFSGDVNFRSATFSGYADFRSATFFKAFSFYYTHFLKMAHFEIMWPRNPLDHHQAFLNATFHDLADFTGSGFRAFAAFDGARFLAGLRMDKAASNDDRQSRQDFETEASQTFDTELKAILSYEDPDSATARKNYPRSAAARRKLTSGKREALLEQLENGCRTLKLEMERQTDKNREQLLYKFELLARREQASTKPFERFLSELYERYADYGADALRPVTALFGLWAAFSLIFSLFFISFADMCALPASSLAYAGSVAHAVTDLRAAPDWDTAGAAGKALLSPVIDTFVFAAKPVTLSASRIFPFGAFEDVSKDFANGLETEKRPLSALMFRILGTFESFLAVALAFLFGLAVRRRFQIS